MCSVQCSVFVFSFYTHELDGILFRFSFSRRSLLMAVNMQQLGAFYWFLSDDVVFCCGNATLVMHGV